MNKEEIQKILDLLERGVISTEEALKLIEVLNKEEKSSKETTAKDDLESFVEKVVDMAKEMGRKGQDFAGKILDNLDFTDYDMADFTMNISEKELLEELEGIESLTVKVVNENLKIRPTDGDFSIQSEVFYSDSTEDVERLYNISFKNGVLKIKNNRKRDKSFNHMNFILHIPRTLQNLSLESVNSNLYVSDISLDSLNLNSINGKVSVYESFIPEVFGKTMNGNLVFKDLESENIKGRSMNGDIWAENITVLKYDLTTLLGSVQLKNIKKI